MYFYISVFIYVCMCIHVDSTAQVNIYLSPIEKHLSAHIIHWYFILVCVDISTGDKEYSNKFMRVKCQT